MRLLERASASRKTPGDGKLEISEKTAVAIGGDRPSLMVMLGGSAEGAQVSSMPCTCGRGGGAKGEHVHYFLACDLFRRLKPDAPVSVLMDDASRDVTIEVE